MPTTIAVPEGLQTDLRRLAGARAERWLRELPALADRMCREWGLAIEGAPMHGARGLVLLVRRGDEPLALKLAWPDAVTTEEYRALPAWAGRGMIRLIDARPEQGAALLERLDASRSLATLPLADAVPIAGALIRTLAVETGESFTTMADRAAGISSTLEPRWQSTGEPFPRHLLDRAREFATHLSKRPPSRTMVNWDLYYDNVLAGARLPWIAIDPMAVLGDPELGLAQLLWTRLDEMSGPADLRAHLDSLVHHAGLERDLARDWTLVRLVDYWLWGLGIGLTHDPARCETIIAWLGF
ncbi:MAG: aminoglycoside phosphotransferase family protein [Thermomicrobiales bacterium]